MINVQCDSCGDEIKPGKAAKLGIFIPKPGTNKGIATAFGVEEGEAQQFDICMECANTYLVNLNQKRLELRRAGRTVPQ